MDFLGGGAEPRHLWGWPSVDVPSPNDLKDQANDLVDDGKKGLDEAGKQAGNAAGHVGNQAGNAAGHVGNAAGDAAGHVGNAAGDAAHHAGNAAGQVGNAVGDAVDTVKEAAGVSFDFVKDQFQKAGKTLEQGVLVVKSAFDSTLKFASKMDKVFEDFKPLEPIFASSHGIVPLLTSKENLRNLITFLTDLLEEAAEIVDIGNAVGLVADIFDKLYKLFSEELAKLDPRIKGTRRLEVNVAGVKVPTDLKDLNIDFTSLLAGLDFEGIKVVFEKFKKQATDLVGSIKGINGTLSPLLNEVKAALDERRLNDVFGMSSKAMEDTKEVAQEIQANQVKYEGAILEVTPSWRKTEVLVKDVCEETDKAMVEVNALQCRVEGFAKEVKVPGVDVLEGIKLGCKTEIDKKVEATPADCPVASHSESVRDMLSQQAGVLGWTAVTFQYSIIHSSVLRILSGVFVLFGALQLGLIGYLAKDCEFWIEGFFAGLVVWSVVLSVFIVAFGACRGGMIDTCEPKWMLIAVIALSALCAVATVKIQKAQLFLAGFDLGAMIGGCIFFAFKYEEIFNTFVHTDNSKDLMYCLLASALGTGLLLGALTAYFARPLIIIGTSIIGGFGVVFAFAIFLLRFMNTIDVVVWLLLSVAFSTFQFLVSGKEDEGGRLEYNIKYKSCWDKPTEETEHLGTVEGQLVGSP